MASSRRSIAVLTCVPVLIACAKVERPVGHGAAGPSNSAAQETPIASQKGGANEMPASKSSSGRTDTDEEDHILRLVQIEAFSEEYRAAVRAVAAAMAAEGRNPGEYTAKVSLVAGGLLEVYARHDSHHAGRSER